MIQRLFIGMLIFALVFFCTFINGCNKSPEKKPPQSAQNQESAQKPKEPKELKDITKDIESILKEEQKKQEIKEKPNQSEEQNKSGHESAQTQSGEGEKQQGQQKEAKQDSQKSGMQDWTKEEKAVQSIHQKWNLLETFAVKAGAEDSLIMEFETNLDSLTNQVMEKNIMETQKSANKLYGSAIKIDELFQTDNPPQADMMKYFTKESLLAIEEDNWLDAERNVQNLKKQWEKVKTMLDKEGAQLSTQMDYAIHDFDQSITKRNKYVAMIKGEIVSSNIEKIIEEIKKEKDQ
ncbi:MAG: hypothetical protein AAGU27_28255 [Dehalobacterium sp.]